MGLPPLNRRRFLQLLALASLGAPTGLAQRSVLAGAGATTRFLAVADTGSGDANQRAVAQQMALVNRLRPVDLVLLGGDNIYPSGDMDLVQVTFEKPYRELIAAGVPFHAVLGNHDIRTANGERQLAYGPFGMKGRFYTVRQGLVEFFLLDTNMNADWARQLPWLTQSLSRSSAPWKVVVGHHPVYSSGFYGNDHVAKRRFARLFQRYGVALYINGHEHHYERSKPIDGTTYLVVGGGGASLRPVQPLDQSAKAISSFSFAELEAHRDGLSITAWSDKGQRLDRALILPPG